MIPVIQKGYSGVERLAVEMRFGRVAVSEYPLEIERLHVGTVEFCAAALDDHCPTPFDYPHELRKYLRRKVEYRWDGKAPAVKFVKPISTKAFDAVITKEPQDFGMAIWVSDIVEFKDEHRCYFLRGEFIGSARYDELECKGASPDEVRAFAEQLEREWQFEKPCAFALDVGTIGNELALVEVSDAWALGLYGGMNTTEKRDKYAEMLAERWTEMIEAP